MKSALCESWALAVERAAADAPPEAGDRRSRILALVAAVLDRDPGFAATLPLDIDELAIRLADVGDLDPLALLARVQAKLERDMHTLPVAQVQARKGVAALLVTLAKGAENIRRGRPIEEGPDERLERFEALDGEVTEIIEQYLVVTEEEAARPTPLAPYGRCISCGEARRFPLEERPT